MREIIEQGYIYIAMPPLYKVKKGKQEQYLKDEKALELYLTQSAMENAQLYVNPDAPPISGSALETLINQFRKVEESIVKLSKAYPGLVLEKMLNVSRLQPEAFKSRSELERWVKELEAQVIVDGKNGATYEFSVYADSERNIFLPKVDVYVHGISSEYILSQEFFASAAYDAIATLGESLIGLLEPGAFISRGERKSSIDNFKDLIEWLMKEAQRGLMIQRYKGLGEMNPDQLWETTMDPESRRMMLVRIEDAVAADLAFTTLMGDDVEPRRDFIQTNALAVANLDV
jgi:DNA gyrase subunit B